MKYGRFSDKHFKFITLKHTRSVTIQQLAIKPLPRRFYSSFLEQWTCGLMKTKEYVYRDYMGDMCFVREDDYSWIFYPPREEQRGPNLKVTSNEFNNFSLGT
eukprot:CAMPEP_0170480156 /NCGR_PEP_ID=MMETSP0208-20121228/1104_1 /TAXON_ID=197538 /ORGANISM="Strombidium inclinatum, Strain S3" /LENGTH=101 /DNA_ID=CAMNT_0010752655 /DNA_START=273 /DNA_END=578 /DNA_ORIENTATION=-